MYFASGHRYLLHYKPYTQAGHWHAIALVACIIIDTLFAQRVIMSEQPANYKTMLYSEEQVSQRIDEMAAEVIARYRGTKTIFISLLNGAQPFTAKLMFAIQRLDPNFHPNVQSMIISHYGPNREPGAMRVVTDLPPGYRDLTGMRAVVLEDLVDRGSTLHRAAEHLRECGAQSVESIVLVRKHKDPPVDSNVVMVGFDDLPDVWLTGMGMDDHGIAPEANRWAAWIAIANSDD
jgi:hypoxanthine phosphoribosyltransferase